MSDSWQSGEIKGNFNDVIQGYFVLFCYCSARVVVIFGWLWWEEASPTFTIARDTRFLVRVEVASCRPGNVASFVLCPRVLMPYIPLLFLYRASNSPSIQMPNNSHETLVMRGQRPQSLGLKAISLFVSHSHMLQGNFFLGNLLQYRCTCRDTVPNSMSQNLSSHLSCRDWACPSSTAWGEGWLYPLTPPGEMSS